MNTLPLDRADLLDLLGRIDRYHLAAASVVHILALEDLPHECPGGTRTGLGDAATDALFRLYEEIERLGDHAKAITPGPDGKRPPGTRALK